MSTATAASPRQLHVIAAAHKKAANYSITEQKCSSPGKPAKPIKSATSARNGCTPADERRGSEKWVIQASPGALSTCNPIREIIETMNLAENPEKKVIPLSIGDPTVFGNLKPCPEILEALQKAQSSGLYYGYQMAAGMESARKAVAVYHQKTTGNKVKPQDVILASGCSHAIDLCICVLAKPGQNILIPRPGFPLYKTLTSVYGIKYKQYNLLADQNFSVDLEHLESLIDDDTAAIIINNPSNPCGSVFSRQHLLQILELAERHRKPIIADEIYDKFVFSPADLAAHHHNSSGNSARQPLVGQAMHRNGINSSPATPATASKSRKQHSSENGGALIAGYNLENCEPKDIQSVTGVENGLAEEPAKLVLDQLDRFGGKESAASKETCAYAPFIAISSLSKTVPILTCGGISKTCVMPGLRLGWIIINDLQKIFDGSVRSGLSRLTQRLMGPNSLVQGALPEILEKVPESFYAQTMNLIYRNAKLCYDRLRQVKGLRPYMPQGSMYFMIRFEAKCFPNLNGDLDFTSRLMNEESVLVLPGRCFDFPDFFRICLTVPAAVMEEALERITGFCERHYSAACNGQPAPIVTQVPSSIDTGSDGEGKQLPARSGTKVRQVSAAGALKSNQRAASVDQKAPKTGR